VVIDLGSAEARKVVAGGRPAPDDAVGQRRRARERDLCARVELEITSIAAVRIPTIIIGIASGSSILKNICLLPRPIPVADSIINSFTPTIPEYVFIQTGGHARSISARQVGKNPVFRTGINKISNAIPGINLKKVNIPITEFDILLFFAHRTPSARPKVLLQLSIQGSMHNFQQSPEYKLDYFLLNNL
jgi:hypothetical protein